MQKHRPFPMGLNFLPSDEELIESYLYNKVTGQTIPFVEYFVKEGNVYGEHEPSVIWESLGGPLLNPRENLHIFTKLEKKGEGSRLRRPVASSMGAWEAEKDAEEIVSTKTSLPIGYKKRFRYEGEGSADHHKWIMEELSLHPSLLGTNQTTDYVLCRIWKSESKKRANQETRKQKKPKGANQRKECKNLTVSDNTNER